MRFAPLLPQPRAELAAGLTWAAVGTGQATAKHVLVYHRTPILWMRARAAHSPLRGVLVADQ